MSEGQFLDALGRLGPALLATLEALERIGRRLDPGELPALRRGLAPLAEELRERCQHFREASAPAELEALADQLGIAAGHALTATELFGGSPEAAPDIAAVLRSMSEHCRAQEAVYPLRKALPPVSRFFLEPAFLGDLERLDPDRPGDPSDAASLGVQHASNRLEERGGFTLYVPESHHAGESRPLIVALHGGSGHGRNFLWSWLREARSRRCLLLAATSRGSTWSFNGPDVDAAALASMVEFVKERWSVDDEHVLLTGLSDGATYTLYCGLQPDMPFTAFAPLSGVLHPANFANGNLDRVGGAPIYLVHGARDWMFPVSLARAAADELRVRGAELVFREIDDLSHTYAREENARILEWFDPRLAPVSA